MFSLKFSAVIYRCWQGLTHWQDPALSKENAARISIDRALAENCERVALKRLEELNDFRLEGSLADFPKFAAENEIFEKARAFNHRIFIAREGARDLPSLKNTIYLLARGRYCSWEELSARFCRVSESARQPNPFQAFQTILITKEGHRLVNAGYTEAGICEDSAGLIERELRIKVDIRVASEQSPRTELAIQRVLAECRPETKRELRDKLLRLSRCGGEIEEYLAQNCVVFRTLTTRRSSWNMEIVISRNSPKGPDDEHSFLRLISPEGRVLSFGRWRWDDRRSKKNQRGITCSPDKSEWKIGPSLSEEQCQGPLFVVYGGPIETEIACDLLSSTLTDFRHREGLHYSLLWEGGGNCANYIFDALAKCRLQPPTRYAQIATEPREYFLDLIDHYVLLWTAQLRLRWLRSHPIFIAIVNFIKRLFPHMNYLYIRLFTNQSNADLLCKTFEEEGGRRIFKNSREMGEAFQIASPAKFDKYLQSVFAGGKSTGQAALWRPAYRHHFAKLTGH